MEISFFDLIRLLDGEELTIDGTDVKFDKLELKHIQNDVGNVDFKKLLRFLELQ